MYTNTISQRTSRRNENKKNTTLSEQFKNPVDENSRSMNWYNWW